MSLSLTLAFTDYEWLEPIRRGTIDVKGLDLTVFTDMVGGERHARMMAGEFDVAEFSLGTYITGWPDWDFTALPVFPRRFFPHSRAFVRSDADIETPADLEGKRVWIHSYQNTLALWARGIFSEEYGLDPTAVDWYVSDEEPYPISLPVEVTVADSGRADAIKRNEVDAAIPPTTRQYYPLPENVERLFDDLRPVERAYYERTGFYPLMHTIVVRNDVLADHPWVGTELLKLFRRSHEAFAERVSYEAKYPLVWWQSYREDEANLFGDVWARSFEFEANADELATMIGYANDQGLVDDHPDPREMFHRGDERLE